MLECRGSTGKFELGSKFPLGKDCNFHIFSKALASELLAGYFFI
jgi:hypothetical protein